MMTSQPQSPIAAVIGLGLIGASFAAALRRDGAYQVVGYDLNQTALQQAHASGFIDKRAASMLDAVRQAQVVILAMYVGGIIDALGDISPILKPDTLVLDVGSSKQAIVNAMNTHLPLTVQAVGGHPMTGRATANVDAPTPDLFVGRVFILTQTERGGDAALQRAQTLVAQQLRADVRIMSAPDHDRRLALVSHLARLLPLLLMGAVRRTGDDTLLDLAAGGFRDATHKVMHDMGFWHDVMLSNPQAIADALHTLSAEIDDLAQAIEAGDMTALYDLDAWAKAAWSARYGEG